MARNKSLTDEQLSEIGRFFGILQEPTRLKLLIALKEKPHNVTELTELLKMKQANVSKHLGIMLAAGILTKEKEGLESYYSVQEKGIYQLCELVCGQIQSNAKRSLHRLK